jgi:predicted alpha/beta-hydrolase family hydrolase
MAAMEQAAVMTMAAMAAAAAETTMMPAVAAVPAMAGFRLARWIDQHHSHNGDENRPGHC